MRKFTLRFALFLFLTFTAFLPASILTENIDESVAFIRQKTDFKPEIAIVLGSGLGNLADYIDVEVEIPYETIPGFKMSTLEGFHAMKLIMGTFQGRRVAIMKGRYHTYEGFTAQETTYPIRVLHALGIDKLLLTNAAGGLNPAYNKGEVMIISDHINLMGDSPLIGPNEGSLGPRWPSMLEAYDKEYIKKLEELAHQIDTPVRTGVYVALKGPSFETRAEYKMLHILGADASGMSTVYENIVAKHMGMRVAGLSVISNVGNSDLASESDPDDVPDVAKQAFPTLFYLVSQLVEVM